MCKQWKNYLEFDNFMLLYTYIGFLKKNHKLNEGLKKVVIK